MHRRPDRALAVGEYLHIVLPDSTLAVIETSGTART